MNEQEDVTNIPSLGAVEAELAEEMFNRSVRIGKAEVFELKEFPNSDVPMLREGTLAILVGVPGSKILSTIRQAIKTKNFSLLHIVSNAIDYEIVKSFDPLSVNPEIQHLSDVPSIVDVRYKSKTIAHGLINLPTLEVAEVTALWNGGELDPEGFTYVEYVRGSEQPSCEVMVLMLHPQLSDLELAILEQVPPDLDEIHIEAPSVAWPAVILRVTVAATRQAVRAATPAVLAATRQIYRRATPRVTQFADEFAKELGKRTAQALTFALTLGLDFQKLSRDMSRLRQIQREMAPLLLNFLGHCASKPMHFNNLRK